jgi:hypothetical protein
MAAEQVERNQRAKKHVDGHRTKWFSEDQKSYNFADIQREEAKTAAKTAELLATERLIFELQVEDAAAEKRRRHKKKKKGNSGGGSRKNNKKNRGSDGVGTGTGTKLKTKSIEAGGASSRRGGKRSSK